MGLTIATVTWDRLVLGTNELNQDPLVYQWLRYRHESTEVRSQALDSCNLAECKAGTVPPWKEAEVERGPARFWLHPLIRWFLS